MNDQNPLNDRHLDPVFFPPARPHTRETDTQFNHTPTTTTMTTRLYVLIACEESQAECTAFRELGHEAYSCDVQKCRPNGHPEWHICGDVTPYLQGRTDFVTMDNTSHQVPRWDLIVAHPPCTYLCKVSSVQLYKNLADGETINHRRLHQMTLARAFFMQCYNACAPFVAVENPLPMKRANLPQPSCFVHPSWFGVKYTKKTLYWLRNLPPIMAEVVFPNPRSFVWCSRGKYRSRTFPQLARAIARQWSQYILDEYNKTNNSALR